MRVIAIRQLTGNYGTVIAGQEFTCSDDVARELLAAGVVRRPDPPQVIYETKVIVPEAPEVRARDSFRDVCLSDKEPQGVAPEGH